MAKKSIAETIHPDARIFAKRPASWSENFIRQMSPEAAEQELGAWQYIYDRDEKLSLFDSDGVFNSQLIPDGTDWALGHMKASFATSRMMAQDYWRGVTARNAAADQVKADRMMRGRENLRPGIGGALTEETREHLIPFTKTGSNWLKGAYQGVGSYVDPFAGTRLGWGSAPEDIWEMKDPDWNVKQWLEELNESDPTYHAFLMQRYGSAERMEETIGESNNSDHFFYLLNTDIEQRGIQASIQHHERQMDGMEEWWNLTAWPFLRDGLLNDPDMPASVAISIATMGAGTLLAGSALALRTGMGVKRLAKVGSLLRTPARQIAKLGHASFKVTDYLPENIATTLVKKHLWKNVPTKGIKGVVANAPFNAVEGFIEGGLAEFFNQSLKIDLGIMDEYSIEAMWDEAVVEAGFSIIANPLLGGLMRYTAGAAMSGTFRVVAGEGGENFWKNTNFSETTRAAFKSMFETMGKDGESPILKALDVYDMSDNIAGTLNNILGTKDRGLTGKNVDIKLAAILEPLTGVLERGQAFEALVAIQEALNEISKEQTESGSNTPMSEEQLIDRLIEWVETSEAVEGTDGPGVIKALKDRAVAAKFKLAAYRHFEKQGMSPHETAEAWENLDLTDEDMINIIMEGDGVKDSMIKGMIDDGTITSSEEFDALSAEQKFAWLQELQGKSEQKLRELEAVFKTKFGKAQRKAAAIEEKAAELGLEPETETRDEAAEAEKQELAKLKEEVESKESEKIAEDIRKEIEKLTNDTDKTQVINDLYETILGRKTLEDFVKSNEGVVEISEEAQTLIGKMRTLVQKGTSFNNPFDETLKSIPGVEGVVNEAAEEVAESLLADQPDDDSGTSDIGTTTDPEGETTAPPQKTFGEVTEERQEQLTNIRAKAVQGRDQAKEEEQVKAFEKLIEEVDEALEEFSIISADLNTIIEENEITGTLKAKLEINGKALRQARQHIINIQERHNWENRLLVESKFAHLFVKWTGKSLQEYGKTGAKGLSKDATIVSKSTQPDLWDILGEMLEGIDDVVIKKDGTETPKNKKAIDSINEIRKSYENNGVLTLKDIDTIRKEYALRRSEIATAASHFNRKETVQKLLKEKSQLTRQYRREKFKIARKNAGALGTAGLQLASVTEALKYRNQQNRRLERHATAFKAVIERKKKLAQKGIPASQLAQYMPDSKIAEDLQNRKGINGEDELISFDDAEKIFEEAQEKKRAYIRRESKPGSFRNMDSYTVQNSPSLATEWNVFALGEVPVSNRSNAQAILETEQRREEADVVEEVTEDRNYRDRKFTKSKIIDRLIERKDADETQRKTLMDLTKPELIEAIEDSDFQRDVQSKAKKKETQVKSLVKFHASLVAVKESHWYKDGEGLVPIAIVDSALPDEIFDTQLVTWFRDAMRDINGQEFDSNTEGESLLALYDSLLVDVDQVLKLVSTALAKSNTDLKNISELGIEALTKKLNDPRTAGSKYGLITSLRLVTRLQAASTSVNRKLFGESADTSGNFVLSHSPHLGYEYNFDDTTTSADEFVGVVTSGFKKRLINRITNLEQGINGSRTLKHLVEKYNISQENRDLNSIADIIFEALLTEADGVTREDIIKMGNGQLSFMPADMLGEQLFEFILTRDGLQPLRSKRNRDFQETELGKLESMINPTNNSIAGGEAEQVIPFIYGELNIIAPEPLEKIALALEDQYLRERIRHVTQGLERDPDNPEFISDAVHEEFDKLIAEVGDLSDNPRAISPQLKPGVRVRSYIQNAVLHGEMLTREETEDALVELLLGHAHTGYYFIHDNKFTNYRTMYNSDVGDTHELLTVGDPTVVPMSGIGSALALAQMSPYLGALPTKIIEEQIRLEREFAEQAGEKYGAEYHKNPQFWEDMLSPDLQKDRKFNGYYVSKLLGITDPEARKAIQKLSDELMESVPDMYINKGIAMFNIIKSENNAHLLGPLGDVFQFMEDNKIVDHTTWEAAVNGTLPDGTAVTPEMSKKLDTLRDFLKMPMMTKLYEAGMPAFEQFWKTGDGVKSIWPKLEEAGLVPKGGLTPGQIPEVIQKIGDAMYLSDTKEKANALSRALNLEDYKDRAKEALELDERFNIEPEDTPRAYEHWTSVVKTLSKQNVDAELDSQLRKADYYKRQLHHNILRMAERRGYKEGTEEFNKFVADERNKIIQAQNRLDEMTEGLNPGEDINGEQEAELMAMLQPKNAWKENLYFLALNTMNASGYKVFTEAMQAQAIALGVEFDMDWLMGLEQFTLYHTFMPGEESHRTYPTAASLNRHHHTVSWGKINDNPEALKEWMSSAEGITAEDLQAVRDGNPSVAMKKVWDWLDSQKDSESPAGVWKMEDNPHYIGPKETVSTEEWNKAEADLRRKVKDLMLIDDLMGLAMFDKLPMESYTREDNMESLDSEILSSLADPGKKRPDALKARIQFQRNASRDQRSVMSKVGKMMSVHPDDVSPVWSRGTREWSVRSLQNRAGTVTETTSNPMGAFSWQPKIENIPYLGLGNLELQRRLLNGEVEEAFGPLKEIQAELDAEADPLADVIPEEHRGHVKPWDRDSLPPATPLSDVDILDSMLGLHFDPAARSAAKMERDLRIWTREHGMEELLDPTSANYDVKVIPYLYLVSKIDQIIEDNLTSSIASIRYNTDNEGQAVHTHKENIIHAANRFKSELMTMFFLPRNVRLKELNGLSMETKGHEIGITNPDLADQPLSVILTSVYDPVNKADGHLMDPTLMNKALGYGLVPKEHFVISEGQNPGEGISIKDGETEVWPLIVQSHDFQMYLVEILWDSHMWPAISEFSRENGKKYDHIFETARQKDESGRFRRKEAWNLIDPEDRQAIIEKAGNIRLNEEANSALFEMSFVAEEMPGTDLVKLIADNSRENLNDERTKAFRNAFGGPFSFLIRARRVVKGATIKFGLTPEGAMLMLASNTNQDLKERLELAYHTKKRLGVKKDSNGHYMSVESESQTIRQEHALDMRAAYDNGMLESDALKIMVNNINGEASVDPRTQFEDDNIKTLVDDTRKVQGMTPRIVDWVHYGTTVRPNGINFLVHSLTAPVRKAQYRLRAAGLSTFKTDFEEKSMMEMLDDVLKNVNEDMTDPNTMRAIQLGLLLRDPDITAEESLAIMDQVTIDDTVDPVHGELTRKTNEASKTLADAREIHTKLNRVLTAPHSLAFTENYRLARVFIEKVSAGEYSIDETMDLNEEFYNWVVDRDTESRYDPLQPNPIARSSEDLAAAFAAATVDHGNSHTMLIGRDANGALLVPRRNANMSKHRSFISAYDNHPKMVQISNLIKERFGDSSIEARMLRSVVARVWEYNPSTILNAEFTLEGLKNFAQKVEDGGYKLGIAAQKDNVPAGKLAYWMAHEFAHIGWMKFVKENSVDAAKWRQLFLKEKRNPNLIRQIVLAAHDGIDSQAVQKEIDYYLNYVDPETGLPSEAEFIAAVTGYYMLNDALPPVAQLEEYKGLKGIIQRIMSYVNQMLMKINGAFHNFKTQQPDEWESMQFLIERTMGYDRKTKTNILENSHVPARTLYMVDTGSSSSHSDEASTDADIAALASELTENEARQEEIATKLDMPTSTLSETERESLAEEYETLKSRRDELNNEITALGGNEKDPFNLTKAEYAMTMNEINRKYGHGDEIDLDALLAAGNKIEYRAIASYITRQLAIMYEGKDGEFTMEADQALELMPWFSQTKGKLRKFMAGGVIGHTGSNFTWNSPFQLVVFLSTIVDNSLTTMSGHWGNWKGLPSIMGTLESQNQNVQAMRTTFDELMTDLTGGTWESLMRLNQLSPDSDKAQEAERIRDQVGRDIIRKIESPELEYESPHLTGNKEAADRADRIVSLYTSMAQNMINLAKEEDFRGTEFEEIMPIRLATGKLSKDRDTIVKAFTEGITKEIQKQLTHKGNFKLDPFVMYEAGLIPSVVDFEKGLGMLENLRNNTDNLGTEGVWKEIIVASRGIEISAEQDVDTKTAMKRAREEFDKGNLANEYGAKLSKRDGAYSSESEEFYRITILPGIIATMKRMRTLNENNGTATQFGLGLAAKDKYRAAAKGKTNLRIKELDTAVMYDSGLVRENKNASINLDSPFSIHIRNIISGAGNNIFFRNSWAIPPVSRMMDIEGVSDAMIYDPASIADGMMRSLGQNAAMKGFFREHLNVRISGTHETAIGDKTPVHSLLNLFSDVFRDGNLLNDDQTRIGQQDMDNLQTSLDTLKEKINVSLGRDSALGTNSDAWQNWLVKYAPDMVRVIYGTNLTMATILVENSMNLMDNLFGRGSVADFVTGATAPLTRMFGSNKSDMKVVAKDMAEILRVFSQAFIPDYLRPDTQSRSNFIQRLPQWLGERNMHLAGQIHEMIATSRAVIFRRWLTRHLSDGSLKELPKHLKGVKPTDIKGLQTAMRNAGVRSNDYNIVAYLMNEGMFDDDAISMDDITKLISTSDDAIYSNGDMLLEASKVDMTTAEGQTAYRKRQKMIAGLKRAEKRFIEDVLIAPNPFDVNTTNESWNKMIEIFRRYPVLFASQQMVRRSRRFSPARTVFHLTSYALFDMLYMQMLLLAAGYSPEELKEKWTDKPTETVLTSLIRLPHLGRYFGLLAEFAMIVGGVGYGRSPMGLIPFTAVQSYASQLRQVLHGAVSSEKDIDPHLPVMLLRILPAFGAFTRMTWFNIMGADYQRPPKGTSTRNRKRQHKGAFAETTNMADYHYLTRATLVETGMYDPDDKGLFHKLPQDAQQAFRDYARDESQRVLQGPESPSEDVAQPQVPQQPAPERRAVRGSQDVIGQIENITPEEAPIEALK